MPPLGIVATMGCACGDFRLPFGFQSVKKVLLLCTWLVEDEYLRTGEILST